MGIRLQSCWKIPNHCLVNLKTNYLYFFCLACFQDIDSGKCEATEEPKNVTRYAYSSTSKTCKAFEYTNCAGNNNNFKTEAECKSFCGNLATPNSENCVYQVFLIERFDWFVSSRIGALAISCGTCGFIIWALGFANSFCTVSGQHSDKLLNLIVLGGCGGRLFVYGLNSLDYNVLKQKCLDKRQLMKENYGTFLDSKL